MYYTVVLLQMMNRTKTRSTGNSQRRRNPIEDKIRDVDCALRRVSNSYDIDKKHKLQRINYLLLKKEAFKRILKNKSINSGSKSNDST